MPGYVEYDRFTREIMVLPGVDKELAEALIFAGYDSLKEIYDADQEDILEVEGMDSEIYAAIMSDLDARNERRLR